MANITDFLEESMTVKELKELLEDYDDNTKVVFSYNYGDYWNTNVAQNIGEVEEEQWLSPNG